MIINAKYVHTNIISKDWKKLSLFYETVFGCTPVLPERDLSGKWIEDGTGIENVHIMGVHLLLPGYGESGPTMEIFQYNNMIDSPSVKINETGFGHIAFHVDDVENSLNEILINGGTQLGKVIVKDIPQVGRLTFVYARDPEGNIIELQNWNKDIAV